MSDQVAVNNQSRPSMAPILGLGAAGVGASFIPKLNPIVDSNYNDTAKLLTMGEDEFKVVADKAAELENGEVKTAFTKVEDGRKVVSAAGDELIKEQRDAAKKLIDNTKEIMSETKVKDAVTGAVKDEKKALDDAVTANYKDIKSAENKQAIKDFKASLDKKISEIKNKTDDGLGKKLADAAEADKKTVMKEIREEAMKDENVKGLYEKIKMLTDDQKNAVKTARNNYKTKFKSAIEEAIKDVEAKADGNKLQKAVAERKGLVEKLSQSVADVKKAAVDKLVGEGGALKDFNLKEIKSILPKSKLKGGLLLGGIGLAVGALISLFTGGNKNA